MNLMNLINLQLTLITILACNISNETALSRHQKYGYKTHFETNYSVLLVPEMT